MSNVTFYNNAFGKEKVDVELTSILKAIKSGNWKTNTEKYRSLDKDSDKAKEYKRSSIPGVTVSGLFPNERKANKIEKHSGFISVDFDNIENLDDARAELYADEFTFCGFISVSGNGLCLIVRIDSTKHLKSFMGLEYYYYTKYNYQLDQSCKDVNRLRFVSYDTDLYLNEKSILFDKLPQKAKGRPKKIEPIITSDDDFEYVVSQIELNRIDLTESYQNWIEIGMAIKSEYGDAGLNYYQRVSQYYSDYNEQKTEQKYRSFSSTGGVSIATFFHHAKLAGLELKTPTTRSITTVATFAKKGRRTKEDAIKQLQVMDGIDPEIAKPIVDKVFNSDTKDVEEDLLQIVEEFLRRECNIKYNEITLKYELDDRPMTDRDLNTIYLDCKRVVPKVNKDLVASCIDSDRTTSYNPVHQFFSKHSNRRPIGVIEDLANCIETNRGNSEYVQYFLRKWLIGAVAMWYKHHSPLMFVLAGFAQNTGKTYFFRYLLPNELQSYFGEAELTGDKDENLLMCNKLIISNDEMSNKSRRDIAMVKKLCSAQWFNLRRPYGRMSEDFRRIAALAGSSNDLALLNDPSGNRRIIPVDVKDINHEKYNAIDKIDLWLEAYHAFKSGEEFYLNSHDITRLEANTDEFQEPSPEYEGVMAYFKPGAVQYLTNTQIKSYVEIRTKQRLSSKKLGMELKKLGFEQILDRSSGSVARVYGVVENSGVLVSKFLEDQAPF